MTLLVVFVLVVLVLVFIVRNASLETKVLQHERLLEQLKDRINEMEQPRPSLQAERAKPAQPPKIETLPPAQAPSASVQVSPPSLPRPVRLPSHTKEEWEALIGGKLLNRIGAAALILGMAFFFSYAVDQHWISEPIRVLIGAVIGALILAAAARTHRKGFLVFAQGLVGAGIAILYLSVYATFNFYHLVTQPVAFVLMTCVTAVAFLHAFRYDSIAVSLIGWLGGFLTPFLLSAGEANEIGLFSYIALLDGGILLAALRRERWLILEPLALAGTSVVYMLWKAEAFAPADVRLTVVFLFLFWGLFHTLDTARISRGQTIFQNARRVTATANAALFTAALVDVIDPWYHDWTAPVVLVAGVIYILSAGLLIKKQPAFEVTIMYYVVTAIALLALATAIQFTGFTTVSLWAIEAAFLIWSGTRWKKRWVWGSALLLFGIAILKALLSRDLLHTDPIESFRLFLNARAIALAVLTAGLAFAAYRFEKLDHPDAFLVRKVLHFAWIITLFLLMTVEVSDYFYRLIALSSGEQKASLFLYRRMYLAAIWMLYSLPLTFFGLRRQVPPMFLSGIGMISIAVGLGGAWGMSYTPVELFRPFTNIRAALLAFLIVGVLMQTQWLAGVRRRYHRLEMLMHFTWGLLLFEFCTVETNDYFRRLLQFAGEANRASLVFARFMTFSAVWMVFSLPLVRLGLARKMKPTLYLGLWALLVSFGMAAIRGISFDPIENYRFVLNYRTLVVALVIAGGLIHATWIKYSGQLFGILYEVLNALKIAIVILILVLLTAETRDYFEAQIFHLKTGQSEAGLAAGLTTLENLKQLSVSTVWLVYSIGLMIVGLWRRNRTFRVVAIALFGITILKMVFYDLAYLETLYRIFAFIGLGVILLIVSYLYQRYKAIILAPTPIDQGSGRDHIVL